MQGIFIMLNLDQLKLRIVLANLSQAVAHIRLNSCIENLPAVFTHQHQMILTVIDAVMLLPVLHPLTIPSQEDSGSSPSPTSRSGFYPQIKTDEYILVSK